MKKFIEFLKKDTGSDIAELSPNHINEKSASSSLEISRVDTLATVSGCLQAGITSNITNISSSDADKFSEKVTELAYSEQFLNEFSDEIGIPEEGESEDEFVMRAKNKMANLLRAKLGE